MTGPQIEDGYTRIANELMENVPMFRLNGTQLRIILVVWRYTYGFKRKDHEFSIGFLAEALNTSKSHADRELAALIDRKVLEVVGVSRSRSRIIAFNKNYSEWINERCTTKGGRVVDVLQKVDDMSTKAGTMSSTKCSTKKERKKNIKKDMSVYEIILSYLNEKTGKRFSHKSEANKKLINGRMNEGRTVEDFIYVIDVKCEEWLENEKMSGYLQPSTLFRPNNFERYLNQTKKSIKPDSEFDSRNNQIEYDKALREWVNNGGDPADFHFDP